MSNEFGMEHNKRSNKGIVTIGVLLFLLVAAVSILISIYLDIIQLDEIGQLSSVYKTNLFYQVIFSVASFAVIFIIVAITNFFIKKNLNRYIYENNLPKRKLPVFSVAAVIALLGAYFTRNFFFQKALTFLNSIEFGKTDPLFSKDIGYYVFQRPFYLSLYDFMLTFWIFLIMYTAVYYFIVMISLFNNTLTVNDLKVKTIIRHNLINIALFFVIKASSYIFQKESLLFSNVVDVKGASYVDVNIWKNYYTFAPFLLLLIVAVAFAFILRNNLKKGAITIAVFPALWILVSIVAGAVQAAVVKPNEPSYESQYLKYNIQKTREAYNLDKIKSVEFPAIKEPTPDIINRNIETKNNIRIVDYQAALDSNAQIQSNTSFYNFHNGDIINYTINGKEIPVLITAREIDKNKIPDKSYPNTTFRYTHGYGVVMNPINKLTSEGQIDFILKDLSISSVDKNLKVTEPRIYYGELTNDHVIVNPPNSGKLKEIDYDGTREINYDGKGGIKLNLLSRLLFTLKYADGNMLISGNISSDSKLLLNRNIIQRAQKAVPFLTIDPDPYLILTGDGRLKWVLDGYTTTENYPYSQDAGVYGNFNYIRNSVKVVIDAYDGEVKYYIIDETDPIIKVYRKIYPDIFSKDSLPADIKAHSRYPELLFKVQTEKLKRYHIDPENVSMFYTKQGLWEIAKNPSSVDANNQRIVETDEVRDIEPYYNMIKLPGGISNKEELILMRPFTPSGGKHNMASWLAVRNSYDNYGEMILFTFPVSTNILGPYQVEASINSIDKVSKDMTLWSQGGSRVFKGNLLVIPIENSILYVEPIYIQSAGTSSIPQVREIIVGYQKGEEFKYGIGANLDEALGQLFAGIKPTTDATTPTTPTEPAQPAQDDKQKLINDIKSKVNEIQKRLDELNKSLEELTR